MKTIKFLSVVFVVVLCFSPALVRAEIIKIGFSGVAAAPDDFYNLLEGQIHQGDPITGYYTYDSSTPPTYPWPTIADYLYNSAPYEMVMTIGSITFQSDPLNPSFGIRITNDEQGHDGYSAGIGNILPLPNGTIVTGAGLALEDNLGLAISSTDLPTIPPYLSVWPTKYLFIRGHDPLTSKHYFLAGGSLTEVHLIPEPMSLCFLVLGGWFLRRKS